MKISIFFKHSKDSHFSLNKKILNLTNVWNFFTKDISSALFLLHSIVVFTFCRKTAPSRLSLRLSTVLFFPIFDSVLFWLIFERFCHNFLFWGMKITFNDSQNKMKIISSKKLTVCTWHISGADEHSRIIAVQWKNGRFALPIMPIGEHKRVSRLCQPLCQMWNFPKDFWVKEAVTQSCRSPNFSSL